MKEKPAAKNACAITKEERAQKSECVNGRKGAERLSSVSGMDYKVSEVSLVGAKIFFPPILVHGLE